MRQPSILIFGNGYLGKRLSAALPNTTLSPQVVHTVNDMVGFIRSFGSFPDVVINCIKYSRKVTTIDDHLAMLESNVTVPLILAEACRLTGSFMIHCSSDHVFSGQKAPNEAWQEHDPPRPMTPYGRAKAAADLALLDLSHVAILRFRAVIDYIPSPNNFLNRLVSYARVADIAYSATFLEDLVVGIQTIARHRMGGVYHAFNPGGFYNDYFLEQYRKHVDPNHRCEMYTTWDPMERLAVGADKYFEHSKKLFEFGTVFRLAPVAIDETLRKYAQYRSSH